MPDAQTLLTVSEGTSRGIPALICAWREGIWPWPACSTCPMITCWTSSTATSARSSAALIAMPPSSVASSDASPPPIFPIGVRAVPRIPVLAMSAKSPGSVAGEPRQCIDDRFEQIVVTESTTALPADTDADTVVIGILDGEGIAHDVEGVL